MRGRSKRRPYTEKKMKKKFPRQRRITKKYLPFIYDIAKIFVEEGKNRTSAEIRIRAELGLERFGANAFNRWREIPEFASALASAEETFANSETQRPELRGPARIAWLVKQETKLKDLLEGADLEKKEKLKVLDAVRAIGEDIRKEELHLEEIKNKRARKSFRRFLKNLRNFAVERKKDTSAIIEFLKDGYSKIDKLMDGVNIADISGNTEGSASRP